MSAGEKTLYEQLGGLPKIQQMVADFYQTILNDDQLNVYYL